MQLKWERGASGVFRRVCKGRRNLHDQCVRRLSVDACLNVNARRFNSALMMSRFVLRFQKVNEIDVRGDPLHCPAIAVVGSGAEKWLRALASLTALTSLNLQQCREVSNNGLHALVGLTALKNLNLWGCDRVSDDGLQALAGLTTLISLNLKQCGQVSNNGLRALAGVTALKDINIWVCDRVSDDGLRALAGLTVLTSLNLQQCRKVSDDALRALASLTVLTTLFVGHCKRVSDDGLRALASLTALAWVRAVGWCMGQLVRLWLLGRRRGGLAMVT
jgi:hypothetical protein